MKGSVPSQSPLVATVARLAVVTSNNTLRKGFGWDDQELIVDNDAVKSAEVLGKSLSSGFELGDGSGGSDAADPVAVVFGEPEVAVGTRADTCGSFFAPRDRELADRDPGFGPDHEQSGRERSAASTRRGPNPEGASKQLFERAT